MFKIFLFNNVVIERNPMFFFTNVGLENTVLSFNIYSKYITEHIFFYCRPTAVRVPFFLFWNQAKNSISSLKVFGKTHDKINLEHEMETIALTQFFTTIAGICENLGNKLRGKSGINEINNIWLNHSLLHYKKYINGVGYGLDEKHACLIRNNEDRNKIQW